MAKTTAMASGVNRYLAAPVSSTTGTKTMQMRQRGNEGRRGDLLRAIQHRAHQRLLHGHVAVRVLDFHGGVVHQDADRQRHAAQGHDVDGLAEQAQQMSEARIESGIEIHTMTVLRQLPRKSRIIIAVSNAAMPASRTTPLMAARTNSD